MKKIFLAAVMIMAAASITFAQNTDQKDIKQAKQELRSERRIMERNEVSDMTKHQFAIDFPHAMSVSYSKTKEFDVVSFTAGRKNQRAYYDYSNNLVGTTQKKAFSDLPESAQKEILKKYAGYTVARVIRYDDNEDNDVDMVLYGATVNDADNYFVELKNSSKEIVIKVDMQGEVSFFSNI